MMMLKERLRAPMCEGKQRFATAALAHAVAERGKNRDGIPDRQSYRCPFCGGWHREKIDQTGARQASRAALGP